MSLTDDLFDLKPFKYRDLFQNLDEPWRAIQGLPDFLASWAEHRIEVEVHPRAVIEGPVSIGPGCRILGQAMICGPAIIGAGCVIGGLVRNSLLGDGCVVGHASEVANSILLPGSVAAHFNYLGHACLGSGAHLGGGVLAANVKLDQSPVSVRIGDRRVLTGMVKFSALIGDGAQFGAGCLLNPGTIVGRGCVVYPGSQLRGWYDPYSQIRVRLIEECRPCRSPQTSTENERSEP